MAHKHSTKQKTQRNDDAESMALHLHSTPAGYTTLTQKVQAARRNDCEWANASITVSHPNLAPAGLVAPTRNVQAEKRNDRAKQDADVMTSRPPSILVPADHTTPTENIRMDVLVGNDAENTGPHLHLASVGYASPKWNTQAEKRSDHDGKDANNITASQQYSSPVKHNTPEHKTQNRKWADGKGKLGSTSRTLPTDEKEVAAAGYAPQGGQRNTGSVFLTGGSAQSASSPEQKGSIERPDNRLNGNHDIPVIAIPDLLERIADDTNILQAIGFIARYPKKAWGYDHRSVREVCEKLISAPGAREELRQQLLRGEYHPDVVRLTQIPKANGKMRTLGIATVQDRIVQRAILQVVEANIPEHTWSPHSYAYQLGRGVQDAIAEVNSIREEGYSHAVKLDMKSFFDNIPHPLLMEKIRIHIVDVRVVELTCAFLTPLVADETGSLTRNEKGTPQGSVISPWLASKLYLNELDQELTRRGVRFVRFADDVTMFYSSKKSANRSMNRIVDFLENRMGCPVNREKTEVVEVEHLSLLGVYWKDDCWRIQRDKERDACAEYQAFLSKYAKTKDAYFLYRAAQQMRGFINGFVRIPGISRRQILALKRWCMNKWLKTGERNLLFDQKWMKITPFEEQL